MSLRLAFDLDGVFADMEGELIRQAEVLFGQPMTRRLLEGARDGSKGVDAPPDAPDSPSDVRPVADGTPDGTPDGTQDDAPPVPLLHMTIRQERRLWRHVKSIENFWETLSEIETGSAADLARLANERRWEIIFLTKRPETAGRTAQVQSQRWLESKGFTLPSVYVVHGSRGRIADALGLDVVVDDRPENCLDVVGDSRARALLVWREDEKVPLASKRLGIGVVKSVAECLDILTQVDSAEDGPSGIVERLMRLLRLKEPATA